MENSNSNYSISDLVSLRAFAKEELAAAEKVLNEVNENLEKLKDKAFREKAQAATERGLYFSLFLDHTTRILGNFCTDYFSLDEANERATATIDRVFKTMQPPVNPADIN